MAATTGGLLVLSEKDVERTLSMRRAIDVNREAFITLAKDDCKVPDRIQMPLPEYKGATLFKPALLNQSGAFGLKVVSVRPDNAAKNIPSTTAVIMLMDVVTGLPSCIMGGTVLTAARTAAGSGVATDLYAIPKPSTLTVFGAGLQARHHVHAMLTVRDSLKTVNIINRSLPRAVGLAQDLLKQYPGVTFRVGLLEDKAVDSSDDMAVAVVRKEEAVRSAQIICTTTNSYTPLFDGTWLSPGCHLNCVGSYTPKMQEVDVATVGQAKVVVDVPNATKEAGDLCIAVEQGKLDAGSVRTLGEHLVGNLPLRQSESDVTLFKSVGVAIQDIATAQAVVESARKEKAGSIVNI